MMLKVLEAGANALDALSDRYRLLCALRRLPQNETVRLVDALSPWLARTIRSVPGCRGADTRIRRLLFERDLRLLHDVLSTSPLAGRYWVWGGMLLGWAREGQLLAHDLVDADFAYEASDESVFEAVAALLEFHGFRRGFSFESNRGRLTEHTFVRHGARFEFFALEPVGDEWRYSVYGPKDRRLFELEARIPRQHLEPFSFLGREWLKVADHDHELSVLYGDWRVPDTKWDYQGIGGVVRQELWPAPHPRRAAPIASGDPRQRRTGAPPQALYDGR